MTDIPSHPYNIDELTVTDGSTTTRTGRSRKQSVKSVLYRVSKFLDGCELGSAYFVNFEELRLKMAILKMKMALLSLKKLKMALCAGTPFFNSKKGIGYEPWHFIVQFRIHHQLLVISCTF